MKIKWSKILLAGIIASIVRYIINTGFGAYFMDLYDPTSGLWRAMMTPDWYTGVIISTIIISFLAVFAYVAVNKALGSKKELAKKGLKFGLIVWLVRDITGSTMTYVFMPVSFTLVLSWAISGFIISMINGLIVAKIYK